MRVENVLKGHGVDVGKYKKGKNISFLGVTPTTGPLKLGTLPIVAQQNANISFLEGRSEVLYNYASNIFITNIETGINRISAHLGGNPICGYDKTSEMILVGTGSYLQKRDLDLNVAVQIQIPTGLFNHLSRIYTDYNSDSIFVSVSGFIYRYNRQTLELISTYSIPDNFIYTTFMEVSDEFLYVIFNSSTVYKYNVLNGSHIELPGSTSQNMCILGEYLHYGTYDSITKSSRFSKLTKAGQIVHNSIKNGSSLTSILKDPLSDHFLTTWRNNDFTCCYVDCIEVKKGVIRKFYPEMEYKANWSNCFTVVDNKSGTLLLHPNDNSYTYMLKFQLSARIL